MLNDGVDEKVFFWLTRKFIFIIIVRVLLRENRERKYVLRDEDKSKKVNKEMSRTLQLYPYKNFHC